MKNKSNGYLLDKSNGYLPFRLEPGDFCTGYILKLKAMGARSFLLGLTFQIEPIYHVPLVLFWLTVMVCFADTNYLLSFLRMKKFNQILSRDSLVTAWELRTRFPQWYKDADPANPRVQAALSTG